MSQVVFVTLGGVVAGATAIVVGYYEYRLLTDRRRSVRGESVTITKPTDVVVEQLTTYPEENEGLASLKALNRLTPNAIGNLVVLGLDEVESRRSGAPLGLPVAPHQGPSFTEDELATAGYVMKTEPGAPGDDRTWFALTDDGRRLVRLILARGTTPGWLWKGAQELRHTE